MQKELLEQQQKSKFLCDELMKPLNVHRWRKLECTDPEMYEFIQKIQSLQKRLIAKTEEVSEKDVLIQEKEKLYIELKNILQESPDVLEARWMLGNLYLELGEGASARKEFEAVADLGRRDDEQAIALTSARLFEGKYRETLGFLSTVQISGNDALVIAMRGEARLGLGEMNGKAFRIGHLGSLTDVMVLSGLATIEMAMADLDYPIELGSGVAAAQDYFRAGKSAVIKNAA